MGFVTVTEVEARVALNVADGQNDWTDPSLIDDFIYAAYRDVVRLMRAGGACLFRRTSDPIIVYAGVRSIGRAAGVSPVSPNPYPADLIRPIEIVEREYIDHPALHYYVRMSQSEGVVESRALTDELQGWEWKYDEIVVIGALLDREIKIEYDAELPDVTGTDELLVPDGGDAITNLATAYALRSRGGQDALAESYENRAQQSIAALVASDIAIRAATSGRWGTQDQRDFETVQSVLRVTSSLVNDGVNDQSIKPLSDAKLMPYVRSAHTDIIQMLRVQRCQYLIKSVVLSAVPNTIDVLGPTTTPALPADMLRPLYLREQDSAEASGFRPMQPISLSGIGTTNERTQSYGTYRGYYRWNNGQIEFPKTGVSPEDGHPYDTDIEITYEIIVAPLLTPNSPLSVAEIGVACAVQAAAYVFMARKWDASQLQARADGLVAKLIDSDKISRETATGQFGVKYLP